jgi:hypothetical protein
MKLPLKNLPLKPGGASTGPYTVTMQLWARSQQEAEEMKEALESFLTHFTLPEMKSAATKLKNPLNRKAIKTFL